MPLFGIHWRSGQWNIEPICDYLSRTPKHQKQFLMLFRKFIYQQNVGRVDYLSVSLLVKNTKGQLFLKGKTTPHAVKSSFYILSLNSNMSGFFLLFFVGFFWWGGGCISFFTWTHTDIS